MSTLAGELPHTIAFPLDVHVRPQLHDRNRLTTFFRLFLSIPHMLLVGGPAAAAVSWAMSPGGHNQYNWGGATGVLGAVAAVCAIIAWFAIVFTGRYPAGLYSLVVFYIRWRARAVAYMTLLRDDYPPFGEGDYPVDLTLAANDQPRNRVSVAFRVFLAIPQLLAVWALSIAWGFTTLIAWVAILLTGRYPESLYKFGTGVMRWTLRVEAYMLLLVDAYPPFSLE